MCIIRSPGPIRPDGIRKAIEPAAPRLLQERGYPVVAAMCIHRENRDSLRDTVWHLASLGVLSLNVNAPQALGCWKRYTEEYALAEDEVWEVYRRNIDQTTPT